MTATTVTAFDFKTLIAHLSATETTDWSLTAGKELGGGCHLFKGPDRLYANILVNEDDIAIDIVRVGRLGSGPKIEMHFSSNAAFLGSQQDGAFAITANAD